METQSRRTGPGPDPGPWLTRREAADRMRVSATTIDRYARDGVLTAHRASAYAHARYSAQEIDAVLSGRGREAL